MPKTMRIALCQIDPIVGDIAGNCKKILDHISRCRALGSDVVVFPELAVTGYPPEDLLLKSKFVQDNTYAVNSIAKQCNDIIVIVGFVNKVKNEIYNSAAVIQNKKIVGIYDKICLPNYGVFDEKRYFSKGKKIHVFTSGDFSFGISICEDLWQKKSPATTILKFGADVVIAINASPFHAGKWKEREKIAKKLAVEGKGSIAYLNLVGGQDELVFDGHSFVINEQGKLIAKAMQFDEDILVFDLEGKNKRIKKQNELKIINLKRFGKSAKEPIGSKMVVPKTGVAEIYNALCLGLKDYVKKNNFKKIIFGLSGGIDSALTAAIASDAIGAENVSAIFMPSIFSADQSKEDSVALANNLGIELSCIPINLIFDSFIKELEPYFKGISFGLAEENLQARIRGTLLMSYSNKFGHLVLATGNKSEVSTGYSTLYGDMAGGLSIIKDVPKTMVYELAEYRNTISQVIPQSIIDRPPTAELRPNQKDQDSLPPYDVLDKIINRYVEEDKSLSSIAKTGIDKDLVSKIIGMIDKNEYKRRQSAPGIKITQKSFGRDRRLPITNKYREDEI